MSRLSRYESEEAIHQAYLDLAHAKDADDQDGLGRIRAVCNEFVRAGFDLPEETGGAIHGINSYVLMNVEMIAEEFDIDLGNERLRMNLLSAVGLAIQESIAVGLRLARTAGGVTSGC